MTLEQQLDFYDIVPKKKELSFSEKYLPTFRQFGQNFLNNLFGPKEKQPEISQQTTNYADHLIIIMPEIPYAAGRNGITPRPFVYVFDRLSEIIEKVPFAEGQERTFTLKMDDRSFKDFDGDIPFMGDDTLVGNGMFAFAAIFQYGEQRFSPLGYNVTSAGNGENNSIRIKLKKKVQMTVEQESVVNSLDQLTNFWHQGFLVFTDDYEKNGIDNRLIAAGYHLNMEMSRADMDMWYLQRADGALIRYHQIPEEMGVDEVKQAGMKTRIDFLAGDSPAVYDVCKSLLDASFKVAVPNLKGCLQYASILRKNGLGYVQEKVVEF